GGGLEVGDVDGARAGRPLQTDLLRAICASAGIPVQAGGGLRDEAAVDVVLAAGAARVVVGTVAVRDPDLCRAICRAHPGRVAVGVDARDGKVRTAGWLEQSSDDPVVMAGRLRAMGAAAIIYTDIARDGTEKGPDVEGTRA